MAPELVPLLEAGSAAEQARLDARQASRKFRDFGERQQWLDRLNAARKEVHGALAKLPHERPSLPSDFASQFFLSTQDRDDRPSDDETPETPEALREHIASLRKTIEDAEARLAEVEAEEAEARKAAEARTAEEAALAELDRAAAELEKKRATLREKLAANPA
jgi:predicted RNase H-like nuclease (RuvC/YqgF family)